MLENISAEILIEIGSKHDIVIYVIGPKRGKYAAHLKNLSDNSVFFTTEFDFDSCEQAISTMTELIHYAENYYAENGADVDEAPRIVSVAEAIQIEINNLNKRRH